MQKQIPLTQMPRLEHPFGQAISSELPTGGGASAGGQSGVRISWRPIVRPHQPVVDEWVWGNGWGARAASLLHADYMPNASDESHTGVCVSWPLCSVRGGGGLRRTAATNRSPHIQRGTCIGRGRTRRGLNNSPHTRPAPRTASHRSPGRSSSGRGRKCLGRCTCGGT